MTQWQLFWSSGGVAVTVQRAQMPLTCWRVTLLFLMSRGDIRLLTTFWCLQRKYIVGKGNEFGFNHKIMIKIKESPPNIMVTRNLWFARVWVRDWLCKGNTHYSSAPDLR
jgi:hypothetical protein